MWGFSAEFWQSVVSVANVIALVGAVATGAALFVSAYVSSDIADRVEREADTKIAEARAQGDEARAEAAKANERASAANERAAALEKEAAEARLKLEQLQPRQLSSDEIDRLTETARKNCSQIKTVPVTAANGNQEAQNFSLSFVKIFKESGCLSDLALPIPGLRPDIVGIHIGVRDMSNIPAPAQSLAEVLQAGGIAFTIGAMAADFFPNEPFVLIVGAKP
jgi:hypothetical protein